MMDVEKKNLQVPIKRFLVSTDEISESLGLCRSAFYALHSSGKLGPLPRKLTSRNLWSVKEFEAWIAADCPIREVWQRMRKEADTLSAMQSV